MKLLGKIAKQYRATGFTADVVRPQFEFFSMTLSSIEGFLLSNWDLADNGLSDADILDLAERLWRIS